MKIKKGILIGGLMLGLFAFGCSKNDYIKITQVEYKLSSYKTAKTETHHETEYTDHVINVYRKGFDKDGISTVAYFLDGKRMTTRIMGHKPGQTLKDVKELDKYPMEIRFHYKSTSSYTDRDGKLVTNPTTIWNELSKGKHNIRVVLEDCEGNTVEDSRDFNVE